MNNIDDAISALRGDDWDLRNDAEAYLVAHGDLDLLRTLVTDIDWKVRLFAVRAIAQLPGPSASAREALQSCLKTETDDWVVRNLQWGITNHSKRGG